VIKINTAPKLNCILSEELKKSPNRYYTDFSELKNPIRSPYILKKIQRPSLERAYNTPIMRSSTKSGDNYDFDSYFKTFINSKSRLGKFPCEGKYINPTALEMVHKKPRNSVISRSKAQVKSIERKKYSSEKLNQYEPSFLFLPLINPKPANIFNTSLTQEKKRYYKS